MGKRSIKITAEQVEVMSRLYPDHRNEDIASIIGISLSTIRIDSQFDTSKYDRVEEGFSDDGSAWEAEDGTSLLIKEKQHVHHHQEG